MDKEPDKKDTPWHDGPWLLCGYEGLEGTEDEPYFFCDSIAGKDGKSVVGAPRDLATGEFIFYDKRHAALAVAAPDLYEALEEAYNMLRLAVEVIEMPAQKTLDKMDAALKKARGDA